MAEFGINVVYLCIHAIFLVHRSAEERAQTAEERALETQYTLKLAEEKIATLEKRLEMMGVDIEAEKKVEEQKEAKEDKVSNDETNLAKDNRSEEGKDKGDNDQKKKSKSSGKSRKK